jgi:DNA-binding IclR family transcriptional regulator
MPMVKSADRAFQILRFISETSDGMNHKELSGALHIPGSSLSALLSNLVDREYLDFDPMSRRYRMGPEILYLAGRYLAGLNIVSVGQPVLRSLVAATGESALLAVRKNEHIQIVMKETCSESIQRVIEVGEQAPLYATAAGKAMLAHLNQEDMESYLTSAVFEPLTKQTITDRGILRAQLKEIRAGAVAFCNRENDEHIVAMAAPVFDLHGSPVASITVPVPGVRFDREKRKTIAPALRETAKSLSHRLGFQGDPAK